MFEPSTVVMTQPIHASAQARIPAAGHRLRALDSPHPLTATQLGQSLDEAAGLVCHLTDLVDENVLAAPRLRVVATVSAGTDHIDMAAAARHGVHVVNTPDVLTEATADHAMALLLAVARRIPEADALVRAGRYRGWRLMDELMGLDVSGTTLGIVGMGRIGEAVARRARTAFGMQILYSGSSVRRHVDLDLDARHVQLDELLARSDFVSLHTPLTRQTRHLLDARALAAMRPHACLINTARGALVDEAALAEALLAGRLAGAGLDVFEDEPVVHERLLECRRQVVLTPHLGSATHRTRERMSHLAVDGLLERLAAG